MSDTAEVDFSPRRFHVHHGKVMKEDTNGYYVAYADYLSEQKMAVAFMNKCVDARKEITRLTALVAKYEAAIDEHKKYRSNIINDPPYFGDTKLWQTRGK